MFKLFSNCNVGKAFITGFLVLTSMSAQAELTSYTANGVDLVYSSVSDVTWTKDADLLTTLISIQGAQTVIKNIIAASPTIKVSPNTSNPSGSGIRRITPSDFGYRSQMVEGVANWYGALAFVNYLNAINYGGSSQWRLPTVIDLGSRGCNYSVNGTDCGYNSATNGVSPGYELTELYYSELGSKAGVDTSGHSQVTEGIVDTENKFEHIANFNYWYGTETHPRVGYNVPDAWYFENWGGRQGSYSKTALFKVWAITAGHITAVPEPESAVMLFAGLALINLAARRRKNAM